MTELLGPGFICYGLIRISPSAQMAGRLVVLLKSDKDPCGVFLKGVGTNSIFSGGCSSWIHKKCSGIPGRLRSDASFKCKWCTEQARPKDGRLMREVTVGREKLGLVLSFCYLGDCLSSDGGCELALLSQDAVSHGANSMSACPSSPPAHFPSHPEEACTIRLSGVPCLHAIETWAQGFLGEDAV